MMWQQIMSIAMDWMYRMGWILPPWTMPMMH